MSETEALGARLAVMVLTDPDCGPGREVAEVVRAALRGGAGCVQLRAKEGTARDMMELGRRLLEETSRAGALLLVNDRVDVALALGADGAHVGDDDLPLEAARRISPPGFLLGRSVETAAQARQAEQEGADYLGVGPVFATQSKADAGPAIGLQGVGAVRAATTLPLVAIGGIDPATAEAVAGSGADGVAVIRAVMQAPDPAAATANLLRAVREGIRGRRA